MERGRCDVTPEKLVYEGWRNTPKPIIYHTHDGKGNEINTECSFFEPQQSEDFEANAKGICTVCGEELKEGGIKSKKLFSNNYTDWSVHKNPEGRYVCAACAFCILLNPAPGRVSLKKYSFVASRDRLKICNRAEMRDVLLEPPKPPFVAVCSESQKKHLITKAAISYSRERYYCNLEERVIPVRREKMIALVRETEVLNSLGVAKAEMLSGRVNISRLFSVYDFEGCERIMKRVEAIKDEPELPIALFVGQKIDEEEALCCMGLQRKTKRRQKRRI